MRTEVRSWRKSVLMLLKSSRPGTEHRAATASGAAPQYAGLWVRFAALAMDGLLLSAIFLPVTRLVKGVWLMSPGDHG